MAEYINRDAVLRDIEEAMKFRGLGLLVGTAMKRYIERQPAADVYTEEDVRNAYTDGYSTGMAQGMEKTVRHGRWEVFRKGDWTSVYECSECRRRVTVGCDKDKADARLKKLYPYCHCGARMDDVPDKNVVNTIPVNDLYNEDGEG